MIYINQFAFIVFCTFSVVTGYYLAKWFWFYASEGMDEIIDLISRAFKK